MNVVTSCALASKVSAEAMSLGPAATGQEEEEEGHWVLAGLVGVHLLFSSSCSWEFPGSPNGSSKKRCSHALKACQAKSHSQSVEEEGKKVM